MSDASVTLPLFPLHTVLFPGGVLPLRVFEQRYIRMTKSCIADGSAFVVVSIVRGTEVATPGAGTRGEKPDFARVGTRATIESWDMPEPGILHLRARGDARVRVEADAMQQDGLVTGSCIALPPEAARDLPDSMQPVARVLGILLERIGADSGIGERHLDDASWVGYRLAELLPLPVSIRQSMLEMNDSEARLAIISRFLVEQRVL